MLLGESPLGLRDRLVGRDGVEIRAESPLYEIVKYPVRYHAVLLAVHFHLVRHGRWRRDGGGDLCGEEFEKWPLDGLHLVGLALAFGR